MYRQMKLNFSPGSVCAGTSSYSVDHIHGDHGAGGKCRGSDQCIPVFYCHVAILVSTCCCNKTSWARWLKQRHLLSHSSGGWTSEIRVPAMLGSGEGSVLGFQTATCSLSAHMGFLQCVQGEKETETDRERAHSGVSSYKGPNPTLGVPHSGPHHLPKVPLPTPSHWGLEL